MTSLDSTWMMNYCQSYLKMIYFQSFHLQVFYDDEVDFKALGGYFLKNFVVDFGISHESYMNKDQMVTDYYHNDMFLHYLMNHNLIQEIETVLDSLYCYYFVPLWWFDSQVEQMGCYQDVGEAANVKYTFLLNYNKYIYLVNLVGNAFSIDFSSNILIFLLQSIMYSIIL